MRYACFSIYILCVLAASAKADQFCFALAETYYEQVYCQLQAKAQTKGLPPFNQFKKNNEAVQASLLKRPAERNGIKLPVVVHKTQAPVVVATPAKIANKPAVNAPVIVANKTDVTGVIATPNIAVDVPGVAGMTNAAGCEMVANQIHCANQVFKLIGNKANHRLATGALSADNKMDLPAYQGGGLNPYLAETYGQYISKMCDIGLCGVTMSYRKFAYLYQDLHSKGLDFSQRFEIMYSFLKKDKASMGVSESFSIPKDASIEDCSQLTAMRYACDYQGRNYIFELQ